VATAARSPEAAPIGDGILGVMIVQGGFGGEPKSARELARGVKGVREVKNDLVVR
jgi:hypothetical protein